MACSPAQLESNRRNALLSTGPRTPEGKARSRANGLKHGLTGAGVCLPTEDAEEVARTYETLEAEMAPANELARKLVRRVALMTVKLDRCAEHEARAISYRMRRAVAEFDDARLAEVETAYSYIAKEPETNARRLRSSPEGIDRLIVVFEALKVDLGRPEGVWWDWQHCEHLHHITGRRRVDIPVSRDRALTEAIGGNFNHLGPADAPDLVKSERQAWAVARLLERLDAQIEEHRALREGLDLEGLELDRAEAPSRALFDPSPAAVLARKYEAAAERGLFRALREFRQVQAEGPMAGSESGPGRELEAEPAEELASCLPATPEEDVEEADVDATTPDVDPPTVEAVVEAPSRRPRDPLRASKGRKRGGSGASKPDPGRPQGP